MSGFKQVLKVVRGSTISFVLDTPFDLTEYTITAEIRNQDGDGDLIGTFTSQKQLVPGTDLLGRIAFKLGHTAAEALVPGKADQCFDVKLDYMSGDIVTRRLRTNKVWLDVANYGTH